MQHLVHEQLLFAANIVCVVSLITALPTWLVVPAGLYCFADYAYPRVCAYLKKAKGKK